MAKEYKLSYTASEIDEKLGKVDELSKEIDDFITGEITDYETLADRKILVIGDSISTDSYCGYEKWVTKLIKSGFFSADKVTNNSIHATGFVASLSGDGTDCFLPRLEAIEKPYEYDVVIVFGGINDYIKKIVFADFTSAVDEFFEYLTNTFLNAQLCVLRPLRTSGTWATSEGKYQQDYSEYINIVAKSYCLPVLNLTEESGFYPWIANFKNRWTYAWWVDNSNGTAGNGEIGDGVHPNEEWGETRLAPMIKGFLKSFVVTKSDYEIVVPDTPDEPDTPVGITLTSDDYSVGELKPWGSIYDSGATIRIYTTEIIDLVNNKVSVNCPSPYQFIVYFHSSSECLESTLTGKTAFNLSGNVDDVTKCAISSGTVDGATCCRISLRDSTNTSADLTNRIDEFADAITITIIPKS